MSVENVASEISATIANGPQTAALLTQLIGCSLVFFLSLTAFCILRTQWSSIYAPRLKEPFQPPTVLPKGTYAWIVPLLSMSDNEIVNKLGLDAAMFLSCLSLSTNLCAFVCLIGMTLLAPVNLYAGRSDPNNIGDKNGNEDIFQSNIFSIDHVPNGSPWLAVHATCVWIFSAAVIVTLYRNYRLYIKRRQHFLCYLERGPQTRTVMVLGIPKGYRTKERVEEWYNKLQIGRVRSVSFVHDARVIEKALRRRYRNLCRLEYAAYKLASRAHGTQSRSILHRLGASRYSTVLGDSNSSEGDARAMIDRIPYRDRPKIRMDMCGLYGPTVDAFDHAKREFVFADADVRWKRNHFHEHPYGTAFVEFYSQATANIASQTVIHSNPRKFLTSLAPEPRDVYWPNASLRTSEKTVRTSIFQLVFLFMMLFWAVPTAAITSLISYKAIKRVFPALAKLMIEMPLVRSVVEGVLPTVVIATLTGIVPFVLEAFCTLEGTRSFSGIEKDTMSRLYAFYIANVLFVVTIAGTLWQVLAGLATDPTSVVWLLGRSLPKMSAFFINYTILQAFVIYPVVQLLRVGQLVPFFMEKLFSNTPRSLSDTLSPPSTNYGMFLPAPLLMFTITMVYSAINPLIVIAGVVFFFIARLIHLYQALYVYKPRYEAGGKLWIVVHNAWIATILLFQLTMIGVLLLKDAWYSAVALVPLPFMTALFARYCHTNYTLRGRYLSLDVASGARHAADFSIEERVAGTSTRAEATHEHRAPQTNSEYSEGDRGEGERVQTRSVPDSMWTFHEAALGHRYEPPSSIIRGVLDDEPTDYNMPQLSGRLPQPLFPRGMRHLEIEIKEEANRELETMEAQRGEEYFDRCVPQNERNDEEDEVDEDECANNDVGTRTDGHTALSDNELAANERTGLLARS